MVSRFRGVGFGASAQYNSGTNGFGLGVPFSNLRENSGDEFTGLMSLATRPDWLESNLCSLFS